MLTRVLSLLLLCSVASAATYEIIITVESETSPLVQILDVTPTPEPIPDPEPEPEPEPTPDPEPLPTITGVWVEIPTNFNDIWMAPAANYSGYAGLFAYSSGAFDPVRKRYYMWALGGHGDQIDNALRVSDMGVFSVLMPHTNTAPIAGNPAYKIYDGGVIRPMSAHTYSGSVVIGDWLYRSGYSPANQVGGGSGGDWRYNIESGEIQELAVNPQGHAAIAVNVKGVLYHFGKDGLSRLNSDLTYTTDNNTSTQGWLDTSQHYYACGAYDKNDDVVIVSQPLGVAVWNVGNVTDATQDFDGWTGSTEIVGSSKGGCSYSEYLGGVLLYNQNVSMTDVFYVEPSTKMITRIQLGGAVDAIDMSNRGVFNKFYASDSGVYLFTAPNKLFYAALGE